MKAAIGILAGLVLASGCATVSVTAYAAGKTPAFNENERVESVPLPGFTEELHVEFVAAGQRPRSRRTTTTRPSKPRVVSTEPLPPELSCKVTQTGQSVDHIAASRYGKKWKWATASFFVLEAAVAALYLLSDAPDGKSNVPRRVGGGYLALDALVTAGLFFVPKRDVLETKPRTVVTTVRRDCPAGLVVEAGGKRVEVDARGKLGPVGVQVLDRAMAEPTARIDVRFGSYSAVIAPTPDQRCAWLRGRRKSAEARAVCADAVGRYGRQPITTTLQVAPGTLSGQRTPTLEHRLNMALTQSTR